jgi:hypothetical protein
VELYDLKGGMELWLGRGVEGMREVGNEDRKEEWIVGREG